MTNKNQILPLFALPLAACPNEVVPLHIFEPRYRALMAWCLAEQEAGRGGEFVIARTTGEAAGEVGTVVRLTRVAKRYDDGRLDVVTAGRFRCRVQAVLAGQDYPTAEVVVWEDVSSDWEEALANEVVQLHRKLVQAIRGKSPEAEAYGGVSLLSYFLAPTSGLQVEERQMLLVMQDENERLRYLRDHLSRVLASLVEVQERLALALQGLEIQATQRKNKPAS